ncbi:hypothetical protein GOV05_05280 [Candidatus Woesearchaeota archaeon]|nr:hypothetical protein [Candidatus Woesearchaeota archaeon]
MQNPDYETSRDALIVRRVFAHTDLKKAEYAYSTLTTKLREAEKKGRSQEEIIDKLRGGFIFQSNISMLFYHNIASGLVDEMISKSETLKGLEETIREEKQYIK